MRKILSLIHRPAKRVLFIGALIIFFMLFVSTVLYIGAGVLFDYYSAVDLSESLLAGVRPASVAVSLGSLALEYTSRKRENDAD